MKATTKKKKATKKRKTYLAPRNGAVKVEVEEFDPIPRMKRDLARASATMSAKEARFLVKAYYTMQEERIRAANRIRKLGATPHETLSWCFDQFETLEKSVLAALRNYAKADDLGEWSMGVCGIGPIIAAGLLAHIDVKVPTVGHIYSFAGLVMGQTWKKGERRPWNADLKVLCYKAGESFVKCRRSSKDYYGRLFEEYKARIQTKNESGEYSDQCEEILKEKTFKKDTDAKLWYSGCLTPMDARIIRDMDPEKRQGQTKRLAGKENSGVQMLPPAQIHARARRWTVKLFLSHYHAVGHWLKTDKTPPVPYAIAHEGHVDVIDPPNMGALNGFDAAWQDMTRKA